jgi:hypothetical protein
MLKVMPEGADMEPGQPDASLILVTCGCGSLLRFPLSHIGKPAACPTCKRTLTIVAHRDDPYVHEIHGQLVVQKGPHHVGEQIFLTGASPIEVGKLPGKDLLLVGEKVSRNHCFLEPLGSAWVIQDNQSKNGTYVNRRRVTRQELCNGDQVRIGDYELTYHTVRSGGPPAPPLPREPGRTNVTPAGAAAGPVSAGEGGTEQDALYKMAELIEHLLPPKENGPSGGKS